MGKIKEYYLQALQLSDNEHDVFCLVQEGTGNTVETSELVERIFPYSPMKHLINNVNDDFTIFPHQLIKIRITEEVGSIKYEFFEQKETEEIKNLFIKPDYFADINTDFLK